MSQTLHYWVGDAEIKREMPDAEAEVIPGVFWGEHSVLFTPAYWLSQFWMGGLDQVTRSPYKAHGTLSEELVFCMLGGYGVTAELATAAFEACHEARLISHLETSIDEWATQLQRPLMVNGRQQKYRYPKQKARYIAGAMAYLQKNPLAAHNGRELRDELLKINGVGPKTAGWVARNYLDTDEVAILDIHLIRAGLLCGVFTPSQRVERDYFEMEIRFIDFCNVLTARPAVLDCLIWDQMRAYGRLVFDALASKFSDEKTRFSQQQTKPQMRLIA
jgi:N-glycosylase/DNA lyase